MIRYVSQQQKQRSITHGCVSFERRRTGPHRCHTGARPAACCATSGGDRSHWSIPLGYEGIVSTAGYSCYALPYGVWWDRSNRASHCHGNRGVVTLLCDNGLAVGSAEAWRYADYISGK